MWRCNKKIEGKRGFSIVEAAVAVMIFSFIIQGMMVIFWQGGVIAESSKKRIVANSLARETVEEYFWWGAIPNGTFNLASRTLNGVVYNRRIAASFVPGNANRLRRLDTTVSWGSESFILTTCKSRY
ncbi:MAG: hypothetical protein ABIG46_03190 [Candidatus Omnitrophota bacterium]